VNNLGKDLHLSDIDPDLVRARPFPAEKRLHKIFQRKVGQPKLDKAQHLKVRQAC